MGDARQVLRRPSVLLGCACLLLHALTNGRYGIFRDELYYIVCGQHPDWGYVDHPAIVPLLAAASHALFGNWAWGLRLIPALVMTTTVAGATEFARLIGGARLAQWLTGLCVLLAPIFLLEGLLFISDLFQPLTWLGVGYVLVRLEQTRDERWWLAFGAIVGFSLNTKYLIAFYLVGLAVGLMFTPRRQSLLRPWVYLGALLALAMALPNILWQHAHGWPFLEFSQAAASGKNLALSPLAFFVQQIIFVGPAVMAVSLCGLWACVFRPKVAVAPAFAIAWVVLFVMFDAAHGKVYYQSAVYPTLIAFGSARIERWIALPRFRAAILTTVCALGAVLLPFALPVLPVDSFIRYEKFIGLVPSVGERGTQNLALPQYYADMFGWREMAQQVAAIYQALPASERARAVFFGQNYGEAAAIDLLGRDLGLPAAIGGHNNYFLWGPGVADGSVIITLGGNEDTYRKQFQSVEIAGRTNAPYAMPYEAHSPIYVLKGLKQPLRELWPQVKHYE